MAFLHALISMEFFVFRILIQLFRILSFEFLVQFFVYRKISPEFSVLKNTCSPPDFSVSNFSCSPVEFSIQEITYSRFKFSISKNRNRIFKLGNFLQRSLFENFQFCVYRIKSTSTKVGSYYLESFQIKKANSTKKINIAKYLFN